ncbi:phosphoribosylanthranilate isomerase [bacterium]|nr:phosphoribosylanthranilate isomerase [bacterium]
MSAGAGPVRVKICGVRSVDDALAAVQAGADMIGLNFHPASRRYVDRSAAARIAESVPSGVWCVGVFVDLAREEIEAIRAQVRLDAIQLHGDEPRELLRGWPVPVVRAVRLRSAEEAARAAKEIEPDYFLCEGSSERGHGGVGARFDWTWASAFPAERLFLAGGLDPGNVAEAVRSVRPFAVDVASGVESSPGRKEPALVAEFVKNAKAA